jgi:hypothetical protein
MEKSEGVSVQTQHTLTFEQINSTISGRFGKLDLLCPFCSASRSTAENRRKKVFRVWRDRPDFLTFHCVHCGERGWLRDGKSAPIDIAKIEEMKRAAEKRDAETKLRGAQKAQWLYRQRQSIAGTPAETYLREIRGITCSISSTLGYLPPYKPGHHPALIAPYGVPSEPEPGVLRLESCDVKGVQLTLLLPDGRGKAKNDAGLSKISIGPSLGWPIVLAPPNDGLSLVIAEGIENALSMTSMREFYGCGAWASTGAKKLGALAPVIPSYIETLTILVDDDADGRAGAQALADGLADRQNLEINFAFVRDEERRAA